MPVGIIVSIACTASRIHTVFEFFLRVISRKNKKPKRLAPSIAKFEDMKERNPRRYRVAGLGEWGIAEGLIYENFEERKFDPQELGKVIGVFGLDFGYTNDPTAFFVGFYDAAAKVLYVYDEIYRTGMLNSDIYKAIEGLGYRKEKIIADSAEPKSIDELKGLGLSRIRGARKGRDSVRNGIQFIQGLKIVIHPQCVNFLTEINNYTWAKDRFGKTLNEPIDDMNHLMDAMRYAMEPHIKAKGWLF